MTAAHTDRDWEYFGKTDPYFSVLTHAPLKNKILTDEARREFFATGERYVASLLQVVHDRFGARFRPKRALDFGCGVGRLTLPLSRYCDAIVGMDVSTSMLAIARENAAREGIINATFEKSDDGLSAASGRFDFVHSFIVFQHIPPRRGSVIFRRLVDLLEQDGIGALHVTYSYAEDLGTTRRLVIAAKRSMTPLRWLANLLKGRPMSEPAMQMNEYDLNQLVRILQESGCHEVSLRFSQTSVRGYPFYGVTLLFKKTRLDVSAHA